MTKPIQRTWGMVNAAVVHGNGMLLPWGDACQLKSSNRGGGTEPMSGHQAHYEITSLPDFALVEYIVSKTSIANAWKKRVRSNKGALWC